MLSRRGSPRQVQHRGLAQAQQHLRLLVGKAQADWDVRGLRGEDFNPKMQQIRVHLTLDGPDEDRLAFLKEEFMTRCPIYHTLIEATGVTVTHEVVEVAISMPQ